MTKSVMKQGGDHHIFRTEHSPVRSILLSPWYFPIVLTLAFAIRLCWILIFHPEPVSDFTFYFRSAESIARGYGFTKYSGFATAYFPIGYPLFLAMLFWVFGVSVAVAQTANLILSVASVVLAYWIARDLFKSEQVGRLSLLFLAIYPNNIAYTPLIGVEIFYLFLLFLGVVLLLPCISIKRAAHPRRLLFAGLVFGFATLVKAQTFLLPAFLLFLFPQFSWEGRSLVNRLKRVAILYVALIGVLIPWVVRNYGLYNDIVLSNNDGLNLYIGNGPEANGTWVAIPWIEVGNNTLDEYKINQIARREAIDYIKTYPLQTLTLMPKKLIALFEHGDGVYWNIMGTGSELILARYILRLFDQLNTIYEFVVFVFLIASLLFGCWKRLRLGKGHGWPLLGIVMMLYFIGIYLVYYGAARYHFPIIPWMIIYSAALLSSLFVKVAHGNGLTQKS
jgi:4-amino-4-deoxy-L-arabinose transferase-like glycosyltransferase